MQLKNTLENTKAQLLVGFLQKFSPISLSPLSLSLTLSLSLSLSLQASIPLILLRFFQLRVAHVDRSLGGRRRPEKKNRSENTFRKRDRCRKCSGVGRGEGDLLYKQDAVALNYSSSVNFPFPSSL